MVHIIGVIKPVPMTGGAAPDDRLARQIIEEFFRRCRDLGASGNQTINMVMMGIVGEMLVNNTRSEEEQDLYLRWFVAGVETLLKDNGKRSTARPNPLAEPKAE